MTISPDERRIIQTALQALSGVCDGAMKQDGAGFNKFDSDFGKSLAIQSMTTPLSDNQIINAAKMLRKYRGQLESWGITLPDELVKIASENRPEIWIEKGRIFVNFPRRPNETTLAQIRLVPGRNWNGQNWSFPVASIEQVVKIVPEVSEIELPAETDQPAVDDIPIDDNKQADVLLSLEDDFIIIRFGKGSSEFWTNLNTVKAFSERKYDPDKKLWKTPQRFAKDLLNILKGKIEMTPELKAIVQVHQELAKMSNLASSDFNVPNLRPGNELLPFQRAGVEFKTKATRCLIGDDMGLGKTIQAIGYLALEPKKRPALIVVPASLKLNWKRELKKWLATDDVVAVLSGGNNQMAQILGATIVIINYDILDKWISTLSQMHFEIMVVDECHLIKNPKTIRNKAVKTMSKIVPEIIFMTGTPIVNRPVELFPVLNMIDEKSWPKFTSFAYRYCQAGNNGWGWSANGAANLEELHEFIKPFCIRRTKSQVLTELPPKRRASIIMQFDEKQRQEYLDALEAAKNSSKAAEALRLIEAAKQAAVKGKLPAAIDWIETFIETEKLVVFCTHNLTVEALMTKFGKQTVRLTGSENLQEREIAVDRFQNDDNVRLFVGNIKAAGVGITLTAASNVAFLELGWTPGDHSQAEDRCHRIGQTDSVTAWYLLADDTIEEKIFELIEMKRQWVETVHDGKPNDDLVFSMQQELMQYIKGETANITDNPGEPMTQENQSMFDFVK